MNLNKIFKVIVNCKQLSTIVLGQENGAKILYKHLIRQCNKLPEGPREHYKFMIKQVKEYQIFINNLRIVINNKRDINF